MKKTLLDLAFSNFKCADIIVRGRDDDEAQLNFAAYHLQQSCELALKYLIELFGVRYSRVHSITSLLSELPESGMQLLPSALVDDLWRMSGTVTELESQTRYVTDYMTSVRQVMLVRDLCARLLKEAQRLSSAREQKSSSGNGVTPLKLE